MLHPCKGVRTPPVPLKPRTIITPEQFAELYRVLPDAQSRLLVETAIESGLRRGELTELRVLDIEFATRMLTVSRAVVSLIPRFHPNGGRFLVKEYPEDREYRRFKLSTQITGKFRVHVTERGLGRDDLIFQAPSLDEPRIRKLRLVTDPDRLGRDASCSRAAGWIGSAAQSQAGDRPETVRWAVSSPVHWSPPN